MVKTLARKLPRERAMAKGKVYYVWAKFKTLDDLRTAAPRMKEFLEERYNITIRHSSHIVPVWFYDLRTQREYARAQIETVLSKQNRKKSSVYVRIRRAISHGINFLTSTVTVAGMYNPKERKSEISWWAYFFSSKLEKEITTVHEEVHNLQMNSKVWVSSYNMSDSSYFMAMNAVCEGMAREAENVYKREFAHLYPKTWVNKLKRAIVIATAISFSPVKFTLRMWGKREKYQNMTAKEKIEFIENYPSLYSIVFSPYLDGEKFVNAVIEALGPEQAFRTLLDNPPTSLNEIYTPNTYITAISLTPRRKEEPRSSYLTI